MKHTANACLVLPRQSKPHFQGAKKIPQSDGPPRSMWMDLENTTKVIVQLLASFFNHLHHSSGNQCLVMLVVDIEGVLPSC